ncbi:hypothetical protein [Streptomyces sp. NPDC098781]|uniref:hypothetical protein n=1 Tax=Streptomyces sp. NPDC098781 TaxID=3366097 RepID=UPI0037FA8C96
MSIPDEEPVPAPQDPDTLVAESQVDYYFPVEVVLVGDSTQEMKDDIVQDVWNALYRALG